MTIVDSQKRQLVCKVAFAGAIGSGVGTTFRELRSIVPGGADDVRFPDADAPPVYELRYRPRPLIRRQGLDLVLHLVGYEARPRGEEFAALVEGADGLVLVVDSNPAAGDANRTALDEVEAAFRGHGVELSDRVVMLQYNKRDLADALPIRHLEAALNEGNWPYVATSSHRAQGLQQLLDRLTAEVARQARPPRSWTSGRVDGLRPGFGGTDPAEEEKTQLYSQPRPRAGGLDQADKRLFGRARPAGPWLDPDEDRTVLADEQPAASTSRPPATFIEPQGESIGPVDPEGDHTPPAEDPTLRPGEAPIEDPAPAPTPPAIAAAPAEATRPHTAPPGSIAPPAAPIHSPSSRQELAPWDSRRDEVVAETTPEPAPGPPPAPEIINVRVPALSRHRPTGLGRPQIRGARSIDLPFTANVDGRRQDVVLRVDLGAPGATDGAVTPTTSARKSAAARTVPLSWLLFAVGLFLVVIAALLVGSLD